MPGRHTGNSAHRLARDADLAPIYVPAAMRVGQFFLGRASGVQSPRNGAQLARPHEAANVAGVRYARDECGRRWLESFCREAPRALASRSLAMIWSGVCRSPCIERVRARFPGSRDLHNDRIKPRWAGQLPRSENAVATNRPREGCIAIAITVS